MNTDACRFGTATEEEIMAKLDALFDFCAELHNEVRAHRLQIKELDAKLSDLDHLRI